MNIETSKSSTAGRAKWIKTCLLNAFFFTLITAPPHASAAVVEYSYVNNYPWIYYAVSNPITAEHSYLSGSGPKTLGQVLITVTSGDDNVQTGTQFYAFSVDLFREFTQPVTASFNEAMANWGMHGYGPGSPGANAAKLYNANGGNTQLDAENAYALQLAIWEVLYEPSGNFDVTQGYTTFINASSFNPQNTATYNSIVAKANLFLSQLPDSTASSAATWIQTVNNGAYPLTHTADLIGPFQGTVPIPSAMPLMLSGLVILSGVVRRRTPLS
ncbi:VPLPA-CTERM sorting domain-containing protein [Methylomonas sp. MV1]|uniref:VPLPA-CTERM sorting domain-containing protein n=1 Tax=Methylomonas sp. MV1 TaxID=3073620 RepID=UPI0028A2F9A6|nr:VPLPA-CTERM sorting domain-containing protein [Methylomonas sp. MV1]MDT4329171.1 VPLPA-CTERM sorting domain-containing protein [Methylomonas sp. MV1]